MDWAYAIFVLMFLAGVGLVCLFGEAIDEWVQREDKDRWPPKRRHK